MEVLVSSADIHDNNHRNHCYMCPHLYRGLRLGSLEAESCIKHIVHRAVGIGTCFDAIAVEAPDEEYLDWLLESIELQKTLDIRSKISLRVE